MSGGGNNAKGYSLLDDDNGKMKMVSSSMAAASLSSVVGSGLTIIAVVAFGIMSAVMLNTLITSSSDLKTTVAQLNVLVADANAALDTAQAVQSGIQGAQAHQCSKYRAFGVPGTPQGFDSTLSTSMSKFVNHAVTGRGGTGAFVAGMAGNDTHTYTTGTANFDTGLQWGPDVIFRTTSHGKVVGTVAFLKYMSEHNLNADDPIGQFFPGYDGYQVIVPYVPTILIESVDPITTMASSNQVRFDFPDPHGLNTGDMVAISGAGYAFPRADFMTQPPTLFPHAPTLDDIPENQINAIHSITVNSPTQFDVFVGSSATTGIAGFGGGLVQVALVEPNVYQTVQYACDQEIKYYKLEQGRGYVTIRHVLEQSMGWNYGANPYGLCGTPNNPSMAHYAAARIHDQIQYGQYDSTNLIDAPGSIMSGIGIINWMIARNQIPHMFHAGEGFAYGSHISILGGIMEVADANAQFSTDNPPKARSLETIMQDIMFTPLGMSSSFYFLQDSDPRRTDFLSRMSDLYLEGTTVSFGIVLPGGAFIVDFAYGATNPRGTVFLDAGLMSTPSDQIKFFTMLKSGGLLPDGTRFIPATLIAEMSRTQNVFFNAGSAYTNIQTGVLATWGFGVAVMAQQSDSQSSSSPMGTRVIGWIGEIGSSWNVDYGNDMFSLYITNLAGSLFPRQRTVFRYNEHLKCIDPQDDSLPNRYFVNGA